MTPENDLLDAELVRLEARATGYAPTPLRRLALSILLEAGGPLKAYDLVERARIGGRRLTPATAYRILDHLQAAGLVHKINSLNAYVVCSDERSEAGHHPLILVCRDCRKATEINDGELAEALFSRLSVLGHTVVAGDVEIHCRCDDCAAK